MNSGIGRLCAAVALGVGLSYTFPVPARAQDAVVRQCSDKWAAAKAAGPTGAVTWPKFFSQCRADLAAGTPVVTPVAAQAPAAQPAPLPAAAATPAVETTRTALPAPTQSAMVPAATGSAVFPSALAPQFASETAGEARRDTCLVQYNANKATNGNGGLNWSAKGGGYYSECNNRLKG